MRLLLRASRVVLPLVAAACAAEPEAADRSDDISVRPTDGSSKITVNVPAGMIAANVVVQRDDGAAGPIPVAPGAAVDVSPGRYCVWTVVNDFATTPDCRVEIANSTHVTYTLGGVTFTRSSQDLVFGVDWPTTTNPIGPKFLLLNGVVPHAAGEFKYDPMPIQGMDYYGFTVREGTVTTVDLTSTRGRAALRVLPSSDRTLPTHPNTIGSREVGIQLGVIVRVGGSGATYNAPSTLAAPDKPLLFRSNIFGDVYRTTHMSFRPRGGRGSLDTFQLTTATTPPVVQLGRLDIHPVAVTMPDGSVQNVGGKFAVGREVTQDGVVVQQSTEVDLLLGHGIDVLPGRYVINVSYKHPVDGADRSKTFTVNVP